MGTGYLTPAQLSRIMALKNKREKLKNHIDDLKNKAQPGFYLAQLKKENLLLKDEIHHISARVANG